MTNTWLPADFTVDGQTGFGRDFRGQWVAADEPDPNRRAARVQDQVARLVRDYLAASNLTQGEFATRIDMPRSKFNRLLNGAVWASLPDLERLLGGCGETMASVAWAIGDSSQQPEKIRAVIAQYLHGQLAMLEGDTART